MKNIAAQMVNFDREQMRRIANNMPEQYDEKPQVSDHFAAGHGSPGGEWQELPGRRHETWLRDR
ncbi:replication protein P of bacteriophage [Escherichia coli]|nr:replication protein P of bacteriophage [Escherichia coli]